MWEDARNKNGGRWLINLEKKQRNSELDNYWLEVVRNTSYSALLFISSSIFCVYRYCAWSGKHLKSTVMIFVELSSTFDRKETNWVSGLLIVPTGKVYWKSATNWKNVLEFKSKVRSCTRLTMIAWKNLDLSPSSDTLFNTRNFSNRIYYRDFFLFVFFFFFCPQQCWLRLNFIHSHDPPLCLWYNIPLLWNQNRKKKKKKIDEKRIFTFQVVVGSNL